MFDILTTLLRWENGYFVKKKRRRKRQKYSVYIKLACVMFQFPIFFGSGTLANEVEKPMRKHTAVCLSGLGKRD